MCAANVLHNCADNKCDVTAFWAKKQERLDTDILIPAVSHIQPDDLVLNCVKMRDFIYTQEFCIDGVLPNQSECIHLGSIQELSARRLRTEAMAAEPTDSSPASVQNPAFVNQSGNLSSLQQRAARGTPAARVSANPLSRVRAQG